MLKLFENTFPSNRHNNKLLSELEKAAREYADSPIYDLPFSLFRIYKDSGSREEYEKEYIEHRRRLNVFAILCIAGKSYFRELEDILWAICNEFTWSVPAHLQTRTAENMLYTLDLFNCETGFALSEIYSLLSDKLNPIIKDRIKIEVRRRIITPFQTGEFVTPQNNWAAVCSAGIGAALLYTSEKSEIDNAIPALTKHMNIFLESFASDGCCGEGVLYWEYGFGYFCYFSDMLRAYTNGSVDLFKNPKVQKIAEYRQHMYLSENCIIPFSDSPHKLDFHIGLAHFLAKEYSNITVPDAAYEIKFDFDLRYRWAPFLRDFYWYNPEYTGKTDDKDIYFFEYTQQLIKKTPLYKFAAKGGTNAEPHNHNDIGSFIIFADNKFLLDDPGWPEYDSEYFSPKRYEYLCASSLGHSVPVINGRGQSEGAECCASVISVSGSEFTLDISKAYPNFNGTAMRRFELSEKKIIIEDSFSGDVHDIKERFVTTIFPVINHSSVILANKLEIKFESNNISVTKKRFTPRRNIFNDDKLGDETLYIIDFKPEDSKKCVIECILMNH